MLFLCDLSDKNDLDIRKTGSVIGISIEYRSGYRFTKKMVGMWDSKGGAVSNRHYAT